MLLWWEHIYLQWFCLLGGFFLWVLWSDLLGLSLWPFFGSLFCLIWVLLSLLFIPVHLLGKFVSSPSLSVSVGLLFLGGSLVGSICVGHVFLSIQLFYVFGLEHLIHLCLRLLSISSYSLTFFHTCVLLFFSFPSFLYSSPFSISCIAGLVEVYSFRLLLSGKLLIWPSILIESLAG